MLKLTRRQRSNGIINSCIFLVAIIAIVGPSVVPSAYSLLAIGIVSLVALVFAPGSDFLAPSQRPDQVVFLQPTADDEQDMADMEDLIQDIYKATNKGEALGRVAQYRYKIRHKCAAEIRASRK
jgi:hypothetical protein